MLTGETIEVDDRTSTNVITNVFSDLLDEDDDPDLWQAGLDRILSEFEKGDHLFVEVGRSSHWLRPHQSRWTENGGFAWPAGYGSGSGGFTNSAIPQFDWSVVLERTGTSWEQASFDNYQAQTTV